MERDGEPVELSEVAPASWTWLDPALDEYEIGVVQIDQLLPAPSPRSAGEDHEHIWALAESVTVLPPIMVHRPSMRVVDGMHRLRAAMARGEPEIAVRWYDGDERNIFALAVHANVTHGLPLSLADRRAAAMRIMWTHRHWSDRMIAAIVGLSPRTVGAIRKDGADQRLASAVRIGRDGRARPVSSAEGRRLAGELLLANPDRSLRDVARSTGLAPSTVLDVRRRLQAGQDPVPPRHRSGDRRRATAQTDAGARQDPPATLDDWAAGIRNLRNDPSLCFSEIGRILLRWLSGGPIESDDRSRVVNRLPPHCLDLVAALARRHVQAWHLLVEDLEARVGQTSVGGAPVREDRTTHRSHRVAERRRAAAESSSGRIDTAVRTTAHS